MFNSAKSAEKAFKALHAAGHLGEGAPTDISNFLLMNDGKLDLAKVGDYVGGSEEENKQVGMPRTDPELSRSRSAARSSECGPSPRGSD